MGRRIPVTKIKIKMLLCKYFFHTFVKLRISIFRMKKNILLSLFLLFFYSGFSQTGQFKEIFIDAEYKFMYENFKGAIPLYKKVLKEQPDNANINYRLGLCYLNLEKQDDKIKAIPYLKKAVKNITNDYNEGSYKEDHAPKDAYFYLGNAYRLDMQFENAINVYEKFKSMLSVKEVYYISFVKREIQATRNAIELTKFPVKLDIEPLGKAINTNKYVENYPVVSDDEQTIVFTKGTKNNFSTDVQIDMNDPDYQMDSLYFTRKINGNWSPVINITKMLSSRYDKMVPTSLSADGNTLYFVIDKNDNGDIYTSNYKNGTWSKGKKLNGNIDTRFWESHACVSVDGKALYFTSDRPGGYGGMDIYVSYKDADGNWGKAINLGPTINTEYDEETPFILDDNKTLYFSSQGHYSMGGFDIFHSRLMSNNKWSTPLNLGYPINTVGNDLFYVPKSNGSYAFFPLNSKNISDRGVGGDDIYTIRITPPENQATEIVLKGTITLQDKRPEYPKDLLVYIIDTLTSDTIKKVKPDFSNGQYKTIINAGSYEVLFRASGYQDDDQLLFIPEIYTRSEVVLNSELIPLEVSHGQYVVIKSILFDYGKYDLRRDALIEIEKLFNLMQKNPELYVEVIGHTDSWGSKEFNQKLSENRARAVVNYLTQKGIAPERFVAKGMGESQPIAINETKTGEDSPEGRQLNRRVEIKILKSSPDLVISQEVYVPENLAYQSGMDKLKYEKYTILLASGIKKITKKVDFKMNETLVNGTYYYTTGNFDEKSKALTLLNKLVDNGFSDAKIINLNKLKNIQGSSDQLTTTTISKDENTFFTIQIKALSKPVNKNIFKKLNPAKIEENLGEDGFYRYTYEKIKGYNNAKVTLNQVVNFGYPDAFIVPYGKYHREITKDLVYTIQIASLNTPIKLSHFSNIKGVKEYIGDDGKYKYIYGEYKSMAEAHKDIKKLAKKGYSDAFVINLNKFK